jgi:hypothetical protein
MKLWSLIVLLPFAASSGLAQTRLITTGSFKWDGRRVLISASSDGQAMITALGRYRRIGIFLNPDDSSIAAWSDSSRKLLAKELPSADSNEVVEYEGPALVGTGSGGEVQLVRTVIGKRHSNELVFHSGYGAKLTVTATDSRLNALIRALEQAFQKTRQISPPDSTS